jgi:hypothetical protein
LRLELVTELARIPGLRVIDVAASAAAQDRRGDLGAGAAHLLITGLARSGSRLRTYAQIVEMATMNRVWAQRWQSHPSLILGRTARRWRRSPFGEARADFRTIPTRPGPRCGVRAPRR